MSVDIRLSLCIPTLNRGKFIGETLENILLQLDERAEVVVVDGGSRDNTPEIVRGFGERCARIRYVRSDVDASIPSNEGFDRDCDKAVSLARGDYCWLMTDDDLLAEGAIAKVLSHLDEEHDLMFVAARVCTVDFAQTLVPSLPIVPADKVYGAAAWQDFVRDVGHQLTFVGGIIIRREIWGSRQRAPFYGTGFVHVGVILSAPMRSALAISRPLVIVRYGNGQWRGRAFDIWMFHWPQLIWSFTLLPEAIRATVTPRYPFRRLKQLLWYRALGAYSPEKYRQRLSDQPGLAFRAAAWALAHVPARWANTFCSVTLGVRRSRSVAMQMYDLIHCGHASSLTRRVGRLRGYH